MNNSVDEINHVRVRAAEDLVVSRMKALGLVDKQVSKQIDAHKRDEQHLFSLLSASLSKVIASDLFDMGHDPERPIKRIQFLSGEYPDNERPEGGLCESALAESIYKILIRRLGA